VLEIQQTAILLITRQYRKIKEKIKLSTSANKSFQQYETSYLDNKKCFPIENSSGAERL